MEKSRNLAWLVAWLGALAAVGLHTYLSFKFYALRFGALGGSSMCNFSELWNCDAVSASAYSQFLGVPMAVWGLVTNLIFAFVLLAARLGWVEPPERARRYSLWWATAIFLASIVMGLISVTQLGNLCLFCVMAYGVSVLCFIATWIWAGPERWRATTEDLGQLFGANKGILAAFIAVPAGAFFLNSIFVDNFNMKALGPIANEKVQQWLDAPAKKLLPEKGLVLYKGTGQPKMEIVEFADFRCPHCREAFYSLDAFTESHRDVKLIFKFFPLDGTCNPDTHMTGQGDGISCEAAFVTQCSEKLFKKGWAAHHFLFENQAQLHSLTSREDVQQMACKGLGVDCASLKSCTESAETRGEVQAMASEGVEAGVQGTPTIYVNQKQLGYGQMLPVLETAYRTLHF